MWVESVSQGKKRCVSITKGYKGTRVNVNLIMIY